MIQYKKIYEFTCDECGVTNRFIYKNGETEHDIAKLNGWKICIEEDQDIEDSELICPRCVKEEVST